MYWSPNFLAVVFKKQEISQQVVTRMQDFASEFSKNFQTLTAGGSDPLPHPTPSPAWRQYCCVHPTDHDLALFWLFRPLEQRDINLLTYLLTYLLIYFWRGATGPSRMLEVFWRKKTTLNLKAFLHTSGHLKMDYILPDLQSVTDWHGSRCCICNQPCWQ